LIKTVYKEKADVIFVQDYCSGKFDVLLFFSWLFNIPLMTFHSGSTPDKFLGKNIRKYTIRKANWIFSSGSNVTRGLLSKFKVNRNSINIIRPPINIQVYTILSKDNACLKLGLNRSRKYLLFIGRFEDGVKRISSIIGAFHKLSKDYPTVDLIIVGAGKDEHDLKNLAMDLIPGRILFPGWVEQDDKKALYYNVSECLILASTREASPAVIGEAFSCGVPVITSDVGGVEDLVIPGKSGWLFPPEDDNALKENVEYVLSNPGKIKEMRNGIRKIAEEKVSVPVIRDALNEGFSSVLNSLN
jgi:glycosyltransferase involved in cell wall biosynthesis